MLSFLAPGYLLGALAAEAALVAAHFIVRRQPRAMVLPTARFVPDAPVLTTGWARVPADMLVLLLRMLCVLLAGLALAQPSFREKAGGVARVIVADRSRAVKDTGEVRDSLRAVRVQGDVVIAYAGAPVEEAQGASPSQTARSERGSLSPALVAAKRAASRYRGRADSVELVIVSTFAAEQIDAATFRIRAEWPGRARIVRVATTADAQSPRAPVVAAGAEDPVAVALRAARAVTPAEVRIVREALSSADSVWARELPQRVLVHWPASAVPTGFVARAQPLVAAGLATKSSAVVTPFQRRSQYAPALGTVAVAWWIDGDVAASEAPIERSCLRSVAVPVSAAGDFVLRPDFHDVVRDLIQPCGGAQAFAPILEPSIAALAGSGPLAVSSAFAKPRPESSPLVQWLLVGAILCALLELLVRRDRRGATQRGEAPVAASEARKVA